MKTISFICLISAFLSATSGLSQTKQGGTGSNYYSKIVVHAGDSMMVEADTLLVDTLIMHDRSRLRFLRKCVIGISHAFIGDRCRFNAAGDNGADGDRLYRYGRPGGDGHALRISIRFEKLGYLSIYTNGGKGGFGLDGQNSLTASENGEDGARGGDGGNGGDVDLFYLSPNFKIVVDEQARYSGFYAAHQIHTVFFNSNGGEPGLGGRGGNVGAATVTSTPVGTVVSGNRDVTKGRNGDSGRIGVKGTVRFLRTQ